MERPRVLIAEDHSLISATIKRLLAEAFEVIDVVSDGRSILERALALLPDILLLDISLPGASGLRALPALRRALPLTRLVVLTSHAEAFYREEAFRCGADGFVVKGRAFTQLIPTLELALANGRLPAHLKH